MCAGGGIIAPSNYPRRTHDAHNKSDNIYWSRGKVTARQRELRNGHLGCVVWLTGLSSVGQVHHRHRARARTLQSRPPCLCAGRRQHPPRPLLGPRLLAGGPRGEHPPRGRGGQAVCRRRGDLHHRLHLALSEGPGLGPAPPARRAVCRGLRQRPAGGLRAARSQGALRQGPRPARSRSSPASPPRTRNLCSPRSNFAPTGSRWPNP